MTEAEFGELFNNTYSTVASTDMAQSGETGIFPHNGYVFSDEDFLAAVATDQPVKTLRRLVLRSNTTSCVKLQ